MSDIQKIDVMVNSYENWNRITPNFIYNRFDLTHASPILLQLTCNGHIKLIPVCINSRRAVIGSWGLEIEEEEVQLISKFLFNTFKLFQVQFCKVVMNDNDEKIAWENDFVVMLPDTPQELEGRHSKKGRYNLKRSFRLARESFMDVSFREYKKGDAQFLDLVCVYFELKKRTHGTNYNMSMQAYVDKYYVTNVYVLRFGQVVAGIVVSCEQCPCVYLENLAYNKDFAGYSPGYIAYDMYLKVLIQKGKESVFLGGGNLDYKKKYDAIERKVKNMTVYNRKLGARIGRMPEKIWGGGIAS